jgi:hypothetical protein
MEALEHLSALESIVDKLKAAGPHPLDGNNARRNIAERAGDLARRSAAGL